MNKKTLILSLVLLPCISQAAWLEHSCVEGSHSLGCNFIGKYKTESDCDRAVVADKEMISWSNTRFVCVNDGFDESDHSNYIPDSSITHEFVR